MRQIISHRFPVAVPFRRRYIITPRIIQPVINLNLFSGSLDLRKYPPFFYDFIDQCTAPRHGIMQLPCIFWNMTAKGPGTAESAVRFTGKLGGKRY